MKAEIVDLKSPYRKDIDGLRAISVVAVILYHFGYLDNGYLGVDVFFVISGFLITGIVFNKKTNYQFSIREFYIRRIRRILPLVLFVTSTAFIVGLFTMLPDDLENLVQSIIATNFFGNNILAVLTTKNYWDVINEFKPLMHTWSLAIEEQFYLVYPVIFLLYPRFSKRVLVTSLLVLCSLSAILYLTESKDYLSFYLLPHRFFELALGGVFALLLNKKIIRHNFSAALVFVLFLLLAVDILPISGKARLIAVVVTSCLFLITDNSTSRVTRLLLTNKITVHIGLLSFSLYMWHQIVLAYSRYFVFKSIGIQESALIMIAILALSEISYYFVERPMRYKLKLKSTLIILVIGFSLTTIGSLIIYQKAGVIRDVPELDINYGQHQKNMHSAYNHRIYNYNTEFKENGLTNVLVIGNSFARDWCNVLLESNYGESINLIYQFTPSKTLFYNESISKADIIFLSERDFKSISQMNLPSEKVFCVGTKNFGYSNGFFYNNHNDKYCEQRSEVIDGFIETNKRLKESWGNRYIDLLSPVLDSNQTVQIFTDDCRFISQDCRHFTKAGAIYYSKLLECEIKQTMTSVKGDDSN